MNIRPATVSDGPAVARIYAPYVRETPITFEEVAPSGDEMSRRIGEIIKRNPYYVATAPRTSVEASLVASDAPEQDEVVLGYACASPHHVRASYRWSVDVGIYVEAAAKGRGIGRALYEALLPMLRRQGYLHAFAGIALPNEASVGLHERFGFVHVGTEVATGFKLGAYRDVGWWQLRLVPTLPESPPEPRPWTELG